MRRVMTDAELKLWNVLRAHRLMALSFRRQFPIGGYIVDFACPKHKLIIEVDGSQHGHIEGVARDGQRSNRLERDGWTILRFWNDDVLRDIDSVCTHIVIVVGLMAEDARMQSESGGGDSTRPLRGHPPRGGRDRLHPKPPANDEPHSDRVLGD